MKCVLCTSKFANPSIGGVFRALLAGKARQCWSVAFVTLLLLAGALGNANAQVPGAPVIGTAAAGSAEAFIFFAPPASVGGSGISAYTANCIPSAGASVTGSGITAPITVSGLVNGTLYSCAVTATNASGPSAPSATVSVTPIPGAPLTLIGVKSRKTHGAAGVFDIAIESATALGGAVNVEPRGSGAGHSIVFQFNAAVSSIGTVTAIDEAGAAVSATAAQAGNEVTIMIAGVADNKRVNVSLPAVNGIAVNASASIGFLVGDVNDTRAVNSSDISGVKARAGQSVTAANFRLDVDVTGTINSSDISAAKSRSGTTLRGATVSPAGVVARVEIEQKGLILTQTGAFKQLTAKAFDAQGVLLTTPVTWTSGKPAVITVDASGKATAAASNGSSQIVAVAGGISSAPLVALFTETAPGAILITDSQIIGDPVETTPNALPSFSNTYQVRLSGISHPAIGSILMNTESKVVAGRVVAVDSTGNPIIVTLGLLSAREMFPTLDFTETIDMSNAVVNIPPDIAAAYNITRVGNTFSFTPKASPGKSSPLESTPAKANANATIGTPFAGATGTQALPPFTSCEVSITGVGGQGAPLPIALSAPPLFTVTASPVLDVSFNLLSALLVKRFVITAEPVIKFEGGVSIAAAFEGKIECKAELFAYVVPAGGPLALILGGVVPFGVGFEAGGKITVATMGIGTKVEVKGKIKAGVVCPGGNPPCTFERAMDDFTAKVTPTLDAPSLGDLRVEPSLSAFGYMEASIGNVFLKSLRFDFVKAKAGATLAGSFALKESQIIDPLYASDYKLSLDVSAGAGGKLGDVLTLLGLPAVSALELKASTDIAKSPAGIATGAVTADKASFVSGDIINFTVKLDPATVDFFPIIGPYNVKKIQLTRKVGGVVTVVASVNAAPAQTTFTLAYTAPDSGSVVQFTAFVVTTLLPLDLLSLELGPAVGGVEVVAPPLATVYTPDVAFDAAGNALAVWMQLDARDNIWANRYTVGAGWGTAQVIESHGVGAVVTPQIVSDVAGNAIAMWGKSVDLVSYSIFTNRFTPSTGWGIATPLLENADWSQGLGRADYPEYSIAMNSSGNAIAVWSQYDRAADTFSIWSRKYSPISGWDSATRLSASDGLRYRPIVAIDGSGNAIAAWEGVFDDIGGQIETARFVVGSGWGTAAILPQFGGNPGVSNQQVQLAMDQSGNAMAVWVTLQSVSASRYDSTLGWRPAERIEDFHVFGSAGEPSVVIDATGIVTVTWSYSQRPASNQNPVYRLRYNRFSPGTGWAAPTTIVPDQPAELHSPKLSILAGCRIIATWSERETNASKVWASKFRLTVGWEPPSLVQSITTPFPSAVPVPNAADGNGNAIAVWPLSDGIGQTLWSQFFPRDVGVAGNNCAEASNIVVTTPATAIAGASFPVTVQMRNTFNQVDTNFTGTMQFASNDPVAVLPAAYTFTASDAGTHTFSVTLRTAGARTISAIVGNSGASGNTTINPGAPAQLTFVQQPTDVKVDLPITPAVVLGVVDAFNNTITSANGSVILSLDANPNGASLLGTTQSAVANGRATFAGLSINKLGVFRLGASFSGGLSGTSNLFTVNDGIVPN